MINRAGSGVNVNAAFDLKVTTDTKPEQIKLKNFKSTGPAETQGSGKETSTDTTEAPVGGAKLPNSGETGKRIGSVSMVDTISVMFMAAQQQKELSSRDRQSALDANVANLLASAEKMKEAAAAKKAAALSSAIAGIVGSSVSLAGNSMALKMSVSKVEVKVPKIDMFDSIATQVTKVDKYSDITTRAVSQAASSAGDLSSSIGKVVAAGQEFEADTISANSRKDDAMAAMHEKRYQEANDFRENAKQAQSAVMDFVRALAQSQVETEKAIARNL